jgi:hypothetical protein
LSIIIVALARRKPSKSPRTLLQFFDSIAESKSMKIIFARMPRSIH